MLSKAGIENKDLIRLPFVETFRPSSMKETLAWAALEKSALCEDREKQRFVWPMESTARYRYVHLRTQPYISSTLYKRFSGRISRRNAAGSAPGRTAGPSSRGRVILLQTRSEINSSRSRR